MIQSLLIAASSFLPGTGRGTARPFRRVVEGQLVGAAMARVVIGTAPPSLRATSPFRGGVKC
jgi:hypothetical protein